MLCCMFEIVGLYVLETPHLIVETRRAQSLVSRFNNFFFSMVNYLNDSSLTFFVDSVNSLLQIGDSFQA